MHINFMQNIKADVCVKSIWNTVNDRLSALGASSKTKFFG